MQVGKNPYEIHSHCFLGMWFSNTDVLVFSADLGISGPLTASPGILALSDVDLSGRGQINSHPQPREKVGLLIASLKMDEWLGQVPLEGQLCAH